MHYADKLLERLEKVSRPSGSSSGRTSWTARCPAHNDRNPSLSIEELPSGQILIHCFAGCAAIDVVQAVGLSMTDLFPDGPLGHHLPPNWYLKKQKQAADSEWRHAMTVLKLYHIDRAKGRSHSLDDLKEIWKARQIVSQGESNEFD